MNRDCGFNGTQAVYRRDECRRMKDMYAFEPGQEGQRDLFVRQSTPRTCGAGAEELQAFMSRPGRFDLRPARKHDIEMNVLQRDLRQPIQKPFDDASGATPVEQ